MPSYNMNLQLDLLTYLLGMQELFCEPYLTSTTVCLGQA